MNLLKDILQIQTPFSLFIDPKDVTAGLFPFLQTNKTTKPILSKDLQKELSNEDIINEIDVYQEYIERQKQIEHRLNTIPKNIGILDPEAKEINPLLNDTYKNYYYNPDKFSNTNKQNLLFGKYSDISKIWSQLPMYKNSNDYIQKIKDNQVCLVISGTGSGKTVLVPKFALHALGYAGKVITTNPRRIPSESNAEFAARTLDVRLGREVGLKYMNSDPSKYSRKDGKLIFSTDGHLLAKIMMDPMLYEYDCVIIDEAHERNTRIDQLLLFLRELVLKRKDMKVIVMSATINEQVFIDYFKDPNIKFAILEGTGVPNKHVTEIFIEKPIQLIRDDHTIVNEDNILEISTDIIVDIMIKNKNDGGILVFVGGGNTGRKGCQLLHKKIEKEVKRTGNDIFCEILEASTPNEIKELLIDPQKYKTLELNKNGQSRYKRKVIFSTNVAESSITIDGIRYVIDSGISYDSRYDIIKNTNSLSKLFISKASHKQRKGRVGRTEEGECYNLFTEQEYNTHFPDFTLPPIHTSNLSTFLLKLMINNSQITHVDLPFQYKKSDKTFQFNYTLNEFLCKLIDKPNEDSVREYLRIFEYLGLIEINENKGKITEKGKYVGRFNMIESIPLILFIIESYAFDCLHEAILFAVYIIHSNIIRKNIFIDIRDVVKKGKNETEKKKLSDDYHRKLKRFKHDLGDIHSIINVMQEYISLAYYDANEYTTEEHEKNKIKLEKWYNENYINDELFRKSWKMPDIMKTYNEIKGVIMDIVEEQKITKIQSLYDGKTMEIHENKDINILRSLIHSFVTNIVVMEKGFISNCFPFGRNRTRAKIEENGKRFGSFLGYHIVKERRYGLYNSIDDIFGMKSYKNIVVVPDEELEKIAKNNRYITMLMKECEEMTFYQENSKNTKKNRSMRQNKTKKQRNIKDIMK